MDLDARLKLLDAFKVRLERLFDGGLLARLESALNAFDNMDTTSLDDLRKRVDDLGESVARVQISFDELPKLKPEQLAAIERLADPSVVDLLDWLAGNREALQVLLSLGDTVDGSTEKPDAPGEDPNASDGVDIDPTAVPPKGAPAEENSQAAS